MDRHVRFYHRSLRANNSSRAAARIENKWHKRQRTSLFLTPLFPGPPPPPRTTLRALGLQPLAKTGKSTWSGSSDLLSAICTPLPAAASTHSHRHAHAEHFSRMCPSCSWHAALRASTSTLRQARSHHTPQPGATENRSAPWYRVQRQS